MTELATLTRAAKCMAARHPEWTPEQCADVVREVVAFLEPDLSPRGSVVAYDSNDVDVGHSTGRWLTRTTGPRSAEFVLLPKL